MIISNEQGLLAARYLAASYPLSDCGPKAKVSDDLLAAAREIVEQTPETRTDRVHDARAHLGSGAFNSRDVASKMICRIISDSIR